MKTPVNGQDAPRKGRRRDPGIDKRILDAAVEVYAKVGLTGFNFEAIARESGVGKPAVYLRWSTPRDLLLGMLSTFESVRVLDLGSIRADLKDYIVSLVEFDSTSGGAAFLRWQIEQLYDEGLASMHAQVFRPYVRMARASVARAVARGELMPGTDADLLFMAVRGAVHVKVTSMNVHERRKFHANPAEFADTVIKLVLEGVQAPASSSR